MDLSKILEHLYWELEQLNRAIRSLECVHQSGWQYGSGSEPAPESSRPRARGEKVKAAGIRKVANKTE